MRFKLVFALSFMAMRAMPAFGQQTAEECLDEGNAILIQGKYDEAIQVYDEAIRIDPQFADAWHNKGIDLRLLGRTSEAFEAHVNAQELGAY